MIIIVYFVFPCRFLYDMKLHSNRSTLVSIKAVLTVGMERYTYLERQRCIIYNDIHVTPSTIFGTKTIDNFYVYCCCYYY